MSAYHSSGAGSMERGNHLGTERSVVRQSKLFRQNESGNAMKGILGQENLNWDTERKQGVFAGQAAFDTSGAPPAPAPAPPPAACPYRKGDSVMYTGRDGTVLQVTVSHVSTNVPLGEEPEISVRMPDGNVRETVLARLAPAPRPGPPAAAQSAPPQAAVPDAYDSRRREWVPGVDTGHAAGAMRQHAHSGGGGGGGGGDAAAYTPTAGGSRYSGDPGYRGSWEERNRSGSSRQPAQAPAPAPGAYGTAYESRSYGAGPGRSSSSSSGTGSSRRQRSPPPGFRAQYSSGSGGPTRSSSSSSGTGLSGGGGPTRSSSSSSGKGLRPTRSSSSSQRSSDRDRSSRRSHGSRGYSYDAGSASKAQPDPRGYEQGAAGGARGTGGRTSGASSGGGRWETSSQAAYDQDAYRYRR